MSEPDAALWEAIKIIGGSRHEMREAARLTSAQRAEVITSVGLRFANVDPRNASEFVADQIKLLAADGSSDVRCPA